MHARQEVRRTERRRTGRPARCGRGNRARRRPDDAEVRAGPPGDRRDPSRFRGREGRAPGRTVADRRHTRSGRLLRDDGGIPADRGRGAVAGRTTRSAVPHGPGRWGSAPHPHRTRPPHHRGDPPPGRHRGRDHRRAGPVRRAGRVRRALQRDGGGPPDRLVRRAAGHVSERAGTGCGPPAHQPVLGLPVHGAGRGLPPSQRHRPPRRAHGRRRPADGLPAGVRHPVHRRPGHREPEERHH